MAQCDALRCRSQAPFLSLVGRVTTATDDASALQSAQVASGRCRRRHQATFDLNISLSLRTMRARSDWTA